MLKCTMCGHVEKCCHVLCPVCGEPMKRLEDLPPGAYRVPPQQTAIGTPLVPEDVNTQCKVCGRRIPLHIVTDHKIRGDLSLGICRDCFFDDD